MTHNLKSIASLIDYLNKRERFNCFAEGTTAYKDFQNNFGQVSSWLSMISMTLKANKNEVDRKDIIAGMIKEDGENAVTITKAKIVYADRNQWLPFYHLTICRDLLKAFPKEKDFKHRYISPADYTNQSLKLDYQKLDEGQKNEVNYGFWYSVIADALSDKGLKRLQEEYERYIAALNPIPESMINEYQNHITLTDNPLDFVIDVLKLYSSDYVITKSTDYEILDI